MKLSRYKFIHWDTAPLIVKREVKNLTYDQQRQLEKFFDTGKYYLVESYKNQSESGLWRLTFPFYFLTTVVFNLIVQPLKWLFTGNYYFSARTKVYKIMDIWQKKLKI